MIKKTLMIVGDNEEVPTAMDFSIMPVKQHVLVTDSKVPALITEDGELWINFNANFGYADFETYFKVRVSNAANPNMPKWFPELERYYLAAKQGKLESLWQKETA